MQEAPSLGWSTYGRAPQDYRLFLYLRDGEGRTVTKARGQPYWDMREWAVPPRLPPGICSIVAGWHDLQTGKRLSLPGGEGNPEDGEAVLGEVVVDPDAGGPRRDAVCLMAPESCAFLG